jgi:hypothetical protein
MGGGRQACHGEPLWADGFRSEKVLLLIHTAAAAPPLKLKSESESESGQSGGCDALGLTDWASSYAVTLRSLPLLLHGAAQKVILRTSPTRHPCHRRSTGTQNNAFTRRSGHERSILEESRRWDGQRRLGCTRGPVTSHGYEHMPVSQASRTLGRRSSYFIPCTRRSDSTPQQCLT